MDKKAITPGFTIRIIAGFIEVISIPFIIVNPLNIYADIAFAFGNFLMVLGGLTQ